MNKSEIAERAAREIQDSLIMQHGWQAPGAANWSGVDPVDAKISEIVERAIAESRGQREDGICFIHGGYIGFRCKQCWPDNDPRLSAQYKSNPLGDGEPSSAPPHKCAEHIEDGPVDSCDKCRCANVLNKEDGLPQWENRSRTRVIKNRDCEGGKEFWDHVEKIANTEGLRESGAAQEVSPPSPELDSPEELNRLRNEFAKANERAVKAEGDTRELKAAAAKLVEACRHTDDIWEYVAEVERLLGEPTKE